MHLVERQQLATGKEFRERVDQLLDGCGLQNLHNSDFGHGLLSLACAGEFTGKYKMLVDNFSQWQANTGRVQSIDLQYMRQVVVNPDPSAGTTARKR